MKSNIRNIPPTAPARPSTGRRSSMPEKVRTYDEAAVLVGNEKTLADQREPLHKVKKIKPKCLDGMPLALQLARGPRAGHPDHQPVRPRQNLFPGQADTLVVQMNRGRRASSIARAATRSRSPSSPADRRSTSTRPDADGATMPERRARSHTAADDAESWPTLAKAPEIQQPASLYVYHDRTSSKVIIGSFNSPNDPAAVTLRDDLLKARRPAQWTRRMPRAEVRTEASITMIAPANYLTDVDDRSSRRSDDRRNPTGPGRDAPTRASASDDTIEPTS